ncbi:unnamed protein product [Prorocentrum cordatum]|uniref:Uncharacterized protein n=1 Tax=Prorocentrum cordatum TaxID=2364126 RepID=A0ABN9TNH7_9DINO|nr:unnamed protein product [Polarella glacialis]
MAAAAARCILQEEVGEPRAAPAAGARPPAAAAEERPAAAPAASKAGLQLDPVEQIRYGELQFHSHLGSGEFGQAPRAAPCMILTATYTLWEAAKLVWLSLSPIATSAPACAVQSSYLGSPYVFSLVTLLIEILVGELSCPPLLAVVPCDLEGGPIRDQVLGPPSQWGRIFEFGQLPRPAQYERARAADRAQNLRRLIPALDGDVVAEALVVADPGAAPVDGTRAPDGPCALPPPTPVVRPEDAVALKAGGDLGLNFGVGRLPAPFRRWYDISGSAAVGLERPTSEGWVLSGESCSLLQDGVVKMNSDRDGTSSGHGDGEDEQEFDARILEISRERPSQRFKDFKVAVDLTSEMAWDSGPLAGPRTTKWCLQFILKTNASSQPDIVSLPDVGGLADGEQVLSGAMRDLILQMHRAGLVTLRPERPAAVGIFFVAKKGGRLRAILGAREVNVLFAEPAHARLPAPVSWASVEIGVAGDLVLSQMDVDSAFYRCKAPPGVSDWFALPRAMATAGALRAAAPAAACLLDKKQALDVTGANFGAVIYAGNAGIAGTGDGVISGAELDHGLPGAQFIGVTLGRVSGRISVGHRRCWKVRLAIQGILDEAFCSGELLRHIVDRFTWPWSTVVAASDSDGANATDNGGFGIASRGYQLDIARGCGRQSERWRFAVEGAAEARQRALDDEKADASQPDPARDCPLDELAPELFDIRRGDIGDFSRDWGAESRAALQSAVEALARTSDGEAVVGEFDDGGWHPTGWAHAVGSPDGGFGGCTAPTLSSANRATQNPKILTARSLPMPAGMPVTVEGQDRASQPRALRARRWRREHFSKATQARQFGQFFLEAIRGARPSARMRDRCARDFQRWASDNRLPLNTSADASTVVLEQGPDALAAPTRAKDSDESLLLASIELTYLYPRFITLMKRASHDVVRSFGYRKFSSPFKMFAEVAGLGQTNLHPYMMRHGGACDDALHQARSLEAIMRRGRWAADTSVKRCVPAPPGAVGKRGSMTLLKWEGVDGEESWIRDVEMTNHLQADMSSEFAPEPALEDGGVWDFSGDAPTFATPTGPQPEAVPIGLLSAGGGGHLPEARPRAELGRAS